MWYSPHSHFFLKNSVKIQWTPVSASISLTIMDRSLSSNVAMVAMLVLSIIIEGRTNYELSFILTLPSTKCLCHNWTILPSNVAFPQTSFNETWMMGIALLCKVLILTNASCSNIVTWSEKFLVLSSDNSDIVECQWNNHED